MFVFLFRDTKENHMTVKISFCIFCQMLILITSNLEMCLCVKVLINMLIDFTTMGYFHICWGLTSFISVILLNFLSYSLVHTSKLLNIENDIWNGHLFLNSLWGYSLVVHKTEWIVCSHTFWLSFCEFEECLKLCLKHSYRWCPIFIWIDLLSICRFLCVCLSLWIWLKLVLEDWKIC